MRWEAESLGALHAFESGTPAAARGSCMWKLSPDVTYLILIDLRQFLVFML